MKKEVWDGSKRKMSENADGQKKADELGLMRAKPRGSQMNHYDLCRLKGRAMRRRGTVEEEGRGGEGGGTKKGSGGLRR